MPQQQSPVYTNGALLILRLFGRAAPPSYSPFFEGGQGGSRRAVRSSLRSAPLRGSALRALLPSLTLYSQFKTFRLFDNYSDDFLNSWLLCFDS